MAGTIGRMDQLGLRGEWIGFSELVLPKSDVSGGCLSRRGRLMRECRCTIDQIKVATRPVYAMVNRKVERLPQP